MHPIADEIYRSGHVIDAAGARHALSSGIDANEGAFISSFIGERPEITRTLEIGCAYGLSSLHIADAIKDRRGASHIIIDPFQNSQWMGIGINNLNRAGFDFYELRELPSELALPALLQERIEPLDLIFVDGWHTFDHTLLDLFYANLLVSVGGYIIIDDCSWRSVSKAVSYLARYPCFEIIGGATSTGKRLVANRAARILKPAAELLLPHRIYDNYYARAIYPSMVVLRKIAEDRRRWDWFASV